MQIGQSYADFQAQGTCMHAKINAPFVFDRQKRFCRAIPLKKAYHRKVICFPFFHGLFLLPEKAALFVFFTPYGAGFIALLTAITSGGINTSWITIPGRPATTAVHTESTETFSTWSR